MMTAESLLSKCPLLRFTVAETKVLQYVNLFSVCITDGILWGIRIIFPFQSAMVGSPVETLLRYVQYQYC